MCEVSNEILNLNKIEDYYCKIFYKYPDNNKIIFVFNGSLLRKEDNCNLFVKYVQKVLDYYYTRKKQKVTIIANLKNMNKNAINIDFIIKFVKLMKKKYDGLVIMDYFYIINCPKTIKSIYQFIKPFLHIETREKIKLIKESKSQSIEYYISLP